MSEPVSFERKMAFARLVLSQPGLSPRAKLIHTGLIDHLNCETGQCNPHDLTLARTCGTSISTVSRGCAELVGDGWITKTRTRGAPIYDFAFSLLDDRSTLTNQVPPDDRSTVTDQVPDDRSTLTDDISVISPDDRSTLQGRSVNPARMIRH